MFANLVAFNAVEGKTSSGSVEFSGSPNDVIQLTIGAHKYIFDSDGKLRSSSEPQTCINFNAPKVSCDSISNSDNSIPNRKFTPYD